MTLIVVTSGGQGEGKTGVAAALARRLAYGGTPTRLVRARSQNEESFAALDAAWFASLDYVPGTSATTAEPSEIEDPGGDAVVAEIDGDDPIPAGALVVAVGRGRLPELPEGVAPAVYVVTAYDPTTDHPGDEHEGVPVVVLHEDRILSGFAVSELRDLLGAEVLSEGDVGDLTCDHLVVAPIGTDSGLPYFDRYEHKAVLARYDRTDMALAAIRSQPNCLVLTGGRYPSDYVYDAVRATGVPLLLSYADTESSVIALEDLWDRTRFQGEHKLERIDALLEEAGLWDRLLPLINEG